MMVQLFQVGDLVASLSLSLLYYLSLTISVTFTSKNPIFPCIKGNGKEREE